MKRQAQFILLNFLYLACTLAVVQAGDSTPYIVQSKEPFELSCKNATNNSTVRWVHKGEPINNATLFEKLNNGTLKIHTADDGIFNTTVACLNDTNAQIINSYQIYPKPIPSMEKHTVAVEGEKFSLHCGSKDEGRFYKDIQIQWRKNNEVIGPEKNWTEKVRYEADHEINGAILVIIKPVREDAGLWSCVASYTKGFNETDIVNATTTLRVKDKLAALWPFLGICAEVFVLCAIILIYEKKRNKSELEESDTDQSPETKPTPNKDSDVRQRK